MITNENRWDRIYFSPVSNSFYVLGLLDQRFETLAEAVAARDTLPHTADDKATAGVTR